jgi:hypothetical protein
MFYVYLNRKKIVKNMKRFKEMAILSPGWHYKLAVRKSRTTILESNDRGYEVDRCSFGKADESRPKEKPLPGWMTAALQSGKYIVVETISTENGFYKIEGYTLGPENLVERREREASINKFDGWKKFQSTEEDWGYNKKVDEIVYKILQLRCGEEVYLDCSRIELSNERVVQVKKSDLEKIGRIDLFQKRLILEEKTTANPSVTEEYPLSEWIRWTLRGKKLTAVSGKITKSLNKEIHYKDFDVVNDEDGDGWRLNVENENIEIYDISAGIDLISTEIKDFEIVEEVKKYGEYTYESSDGFGGDRTVETCTKYVKVRVHVGGEEITVDAIAE